MEQEFSEAEKEMVAADDENIKTNTGVKELWAEVKALAYNGDFEEALKLYKEILGMKNECIDITLARGVFR